MRGIGMSKTVLIVDDSATQRLMLKKILKIKLPRRENVIAIHYDFPNIWLMIIRTKVIKDIPRGVASTVRNVIANMKPCS